MEFARSEADIAIYGGSAGGGKTFALLYEPIGRELHKVKGFYGVLFRRSYPEITNPGGLWDEAGQIYPYAEGKANVGAREYRFHYGSRIAFRHLENEDSKYDYQGSQICYLAFDELTHFTESMFWYLTSRNRSTCGIRPYVRGSCNPRPGWVKTLLAPWVDVEFPGPRAVSGELRWFVRIDGKIQWVDASTPDARSLTFIRASIYDNPFLLDRDPGYIATLKALPTVERKRLLEGDWDVQREGLVYPDFEACIVDAGPAHPPTHGGIDFGWNNPFASPHGYLDGDDVLWITGNWKASFKTLPVHSEHLPRGVQWWADPAQPGLIAELRHAGHDVRSCVHLSVRGAGGEKKSPILAGIDLVNQRIRTKRLKIVRNPETLSIIREFASYHYDENKSVEEPVKEDDHDLDALRYVITGLDRGRMGGPIMYPTEMEDEIQEQADRKADLERRRKLDEEAQADPLLDRWFDV